MKRPLLMIGAGGFAREVLTYVDYSVYQVVGCFTDNPSKSQGPFGLPLISSFEGLKHVEFLVAVGDPEAKSRLFDRALEAGLVPSLPMIHTRAHVGADNHLARGVMICPGVIITTGAKIGYGVILNLNVTIGHETQIDDFTTVSPGANISGNVLIGKKCYIGTGSSIREGRRIGDGSTVGMGAVVVKDVNLGDTVLGNPARPVELKAVT